jgi:tetraacyldisaccharide 4'-kinase
MKRGRMLLMSYIVPSWWRTRNLLTWLLWPFSLIFAAIVATRRYAYQQGWLPRYRSSLPIIVVGNITVGGTGKTPTVIAIVEWLKQQGYRPAIISRGYKSTQTQFPYWVTPTSPVALAGDEPLLIAKRTSCPVVIDPQRPRAVQALEKANVCDIIISDDGLQHYALARDIEIVVIDGERRFGNGFLLPAGMLREPISRIKKADRVICHGGIAQPGEFHMQLHPARVIALHDPTQTRPLATFTNQTVHAVAGIGNPQRFFNLLQQQGINVIAHPFPDHHTYVASDFAGMQDQYPILLTEKDAVKCASLLTNNAWYVCVDAAIEEKFFHDFDLPSLPRKKLQ